MKLAFQLALACALACPITVTAQFQIGGASTQSGSATTGGTAIGPGVYADPIRGTDNATCPASNPCRHLYAAQIAVRSSASKNVYLAPGTYSLLDEPTPGPWTFSSLDSGTSSTPVVYQSTVGTATITGGRSIAGSVLTYDPTVNCGTSCLDYYIDLDANPADGGYWQNFETLFFNGLRRPRPQATGTYHGYFKNSCTPSTPGLCVGTTNTTLSQANVLCGCPSGGLNNQACAFQDTNVCSGSAPWKCYNVYGYSGTDFNPAWHNLAIGDVEILAFQAWVMDRARAVSGGSGAIQLAGPMGINQEGGCYANHYWIAENVEEEAQAGEWYLDRCPGCASGTETPANTWRLNIYLTTTEAAGIATSTITIPNLSTSNQKLLVANSLQNVTFGNGIEFQMDNWVPGPYGNPDMQGQPNVPAALSFTNSSNIILNGAKIDHTTGWGIEFLGSSNYNQIIDSTLYDIGAGGMRIGAIHSNETSPTQVPGNNLVQNSVVGYYSRIDPTGEAPGIWVGDAHETTVDHNTIFGGYTGGISIGDVLNRGTTGTQFFVANTYVTSNEIWGQCVNGVCNGILNDHGGIYLTPSLAQTGCPTTGPPSLTPTDTYCTHVFGNKVHDIVNNYDDTADQGSQCLYMDQGATNVEARFNLFYRCSHTGYFLNLPDTRLQMLAQYDLVDNNLFAETGATEVPHIRMMHRGGVNGNAFTWTHNIGFFSSAVGTTIQSQVNGKWPCFGDDGTELVDNPVPCTQRFILDYNDWWDAAQAPLSFANCKWQSGLQNNPPNCGVFNSNNWNMFTGMPWGLSSEEDVHSASFDPQFTNPNYPVDDFHMNVNPSALNGLGVLAFDYTQAGAPASVVSAVPSNVPDLFPVRPINQATDFGTFATNSPAPMTVLSVAPSAGSTLGSTPVTITGTGFTALTTVTFGIAAATNIQVNSSSSITATTPSGAGSVAVAVNNHDGGSGSLPNGFTYQ